MEQLMHANLQVIELLAAIFGEVERREAVLAEQPREHDAGPGACDAGPAPHG